MRTPLGRHGVSERRLPDFLDAYVKYTENSESPPSYHMWAGVSVIGAALQRRTWIGWGHTQIFPNQYIVLVGPSGNRKGEPLTIASKILTKLGLSLISEAITRQALIQRMAESVTTFMHGKNVMAQCAVSGVFEEFAVFLGENDTKFLADLTNWYDSRPSWSYETKHGGTDEIAGVCANILASTAPDWIPVVIPSTAIGGGFTSRIIFVVEHQKGKIVEDPNEITEDVKLFNDLLHDLQDIYSIIGEYTFTPTALTAYKEWYRDQETRAAEGKFAILDSRFSGYCSRRATHVKKLSMIMTAARNNNSVIEVQDFDRALRLMCGVEEKMPSVFSAAGKSPYSEQVDTVMEFIKTRGEVSKSSLLKLLYYDIDIRTLEVVEQTLSAMGVVRIVRLAGSGDCLYQWRGAASPTPQE